MLKLLPPPTNDLPTSQVSMQSAVLLDIMEHARRLGLKGKYVNKNDI